jgi:para-nitrobenzyl esterase
VSKAIVTTKCGKLEGLDRNGLCVFKGMPYAEAPVGALRWMPPQPKKPWDGVRPAKQYRSICCQPIIPGVEAFGAPDFSNCVQSEDCLFLNVWTPGLDDKKRPVFFWIHGGAFYIGAGNEPFLEEGVLSRRGDIVVVSINYRLGAFGFINLNEITGGKIPATGNEGLLDQVAALLWVKENIADFGGDPERITIGGFSAGGMSVATLLGLPAAKGMFQQAMNRSGAANIVGTLESCMEVAKEYLEILGVNANDADALRAVPSDTILDCQMKLVAQINQRENRTTPFQPCVDGKVLPEMPLIAIRNGAAKNIPTMAGSSEEEMKFMNSMNPEIKDMTEEKLISVLRKMVKAELIPNLVNLYRAAIKERGGMATPADIFGLINTDWIFRIPTLQLLEAQRDNGAPDYNYLFTYKSPAMNGALGAIHGIDNPFLFGLLDRNFTGLSEEAEKLAVKVQDSAIAFIKTGDPSCPSAGVWPVYGKDRLTMIFDAKSGVARQFNEKERTAWDGYDFIYNWLV